MRIVCPSCDATYDVPDAMLAGGARKVRCVRCGNEWVPTAVTVAPLAFEEPQAETPAYRPPPSPEPPPLEPLARVEPRLHPLRPRHDTAREMTEPVLEEAPPPRAGAAAMVAWGVSLAVLLALGVAAVQWRAELMAAWPPSERLFAALGLG
jgi:predicted Zn finger-like uncharacterized protein